MIILAADTSTSFGSAALRDRGGTVLVEKLDPGKPHSETLLPAVDRILDRAGLSKVEIQAIAAGTGPGAFTGLRVGLATFKAWAAAAGIPLVPVVSLDAVALPYLVEGNPVAVLADARKDEVYAAYYPALDSQGLPDREGEILLLPRDQVNGWMRAFREPGLITAGNAAACAADSGVPVLPDGDHEGAQVPEAAQILVLGERLFSMGRTVEPPDLVPTYVRPPDAQIPAPGTIITGGIPSGD